VSEYGGGHWFPFVSASELVCVLAVIGNNASLDATKNNGF
jgi:hypothetical protein